MHQSIIFWFYDLTHLFKLYSPITTAQSPSTKTPGKTIVVVADETYICPTIARKYKFTTTLTLRHG